MNPDMFSFVFRKNFRFVAVSWLETRGFRCNFQNLRFENYTKITPRPPKLHRAQYAGLHADPSIAYYSACGHATSDIIGASTPRGAKIFWLLIVSWAALWRCNFRQNRENYTSAGSRNPSETMKNFNTGEYHRKGRMGHNLLCAVV